MSWTFLPSLLGINLMFWGFIYGRDGGSMRTAVMLVTVGVALMALWFWMVRREGRG